MPDLSLPRELGSDVAVTCTECGSPRELAMSDYGSFAPVPCSNCGRTAGFKPVTPVTIEPPVEIDIPVTDA